MVPGLGVIFLVVTLVEAWLLVTVGSRIGFVPTVALVVAVSFVGAALVKREGMSVVRNVRAQMQQGRVPGRELADGALILVGGTLLLTPGFLSDIAGLGLLLPPVRAVVRTWLLARLARRVRRRTGIVDIGRRRR